MAKLITPPPRPQPIKEPGYTPELRPTRIDGSISNRGKTGVDAQRTPLGVYRKAVSKLIESTWMRRTRTEMPSLAVGTVRIRFNITQSGHIEDLKVVSNDSNKSFELICEQSVREANVAPPPADLGVMKDGRLELVFSFTLYDTH
jgi:outer membrane biosynthesis protein TonB